MFAAPAPSGGYSVTKKIPVAGQGSFDYLSVDEGARRLYVSHGTQVEVLDTDSGTVVGTIPKTLGVHGIAIAPELGRGFVSNGQASTVTIFDLKTLKPIADVPTGTPHGQQNRRWRKYSRRAPAIGLRMHLPMIHADKMMLVCFGCSFCGLIAGILAPARGRFATTLGSLIIAMLIVAIPMGVL
jgi:hypothetical protein